MLTYQKPKCYTNLLWEKENPKCKGGFDITYQDGDTNIRPKCAYYDACAQRKMASRFAQVGLSQDAPKDSPSLNVPYFQQKSAPSSITATTAAAAASYSYPGAKVVVTAPPTAPTTANQPPSAISQNTAHPFATVAANIPTYLSVPEPYKEDDSFPQYMSRVIIRYLIKAAGHAIAHIFDTTVLRR